MQSISYTVYSRDTSDGRCELIYVSQGLGGADGLWMAVYRSLSGGEHRIKSIPMMPSKDDAQAKLDDYAKKKGFSPHTIYTGNGAARRPMTWEEATRR